MMYRIKLSMICLNTIAKPNVLQLCKSQLSYLPAKVKIELITILCRRGLIKDAYVLKQLLNSELRVVDLSECIVRDDMLSSLNVCKNLRKLDLSLRRRQTRFITSKTLSTAFENFPHLEILAIPHCKEVNDEVIEALCKNCPKILELYIPYSSISDNGLFCIGQNLCQLLIINLYGTQITDNGVYHLINGPISQTLVEINIDKCPNTTSLSTSIIAKNCPRILVFTCGPSTKHEEMVSSINGIALRTKQIFWHV